MGSFSYLYQTDDAYSVLHIGPEMSKLRDENTHVVVRMYEEKEPAEKRTKHTKVKKTDALTVAGLELFEKLRALRFDIAREESLPPYIIFSDKTLVDMCVKLPHTKEEMMNVNGVGENKFARYGRLFLDEIESYTDDHPNAIVSEQTDITDGTPRITTEKKVYRKTNKQEFYLTSEQAEQFEYGDMYYISEIRDHLNMLLDNISVKKVTIQTIWNFLVDEGLTFEENREGVFVKTKTEKGNKAGIEIVRKVAASGLPYELLRYPESIQKLIVDFFVKGIEDSVRDKYLEEER